MFVRQFAITAAAIIATTITVSSAVHAESRIDARVSFSPTELSTEAGRHAVIKRIRSAAYRACSTDNVPSDPLENMRCVRNLSSQMIAKVPGASFVARDPAGDKVASR